MAEFLADLPDPVVLLYEEDGPLGAPAQLQLRHVRLVLPPLPVGGDDHLAVAQLGPVAPRNEAAPELLDEDDQLFDPLAPPLLQLVEAGEAADEDLGTAEDVLIGANRQFAQEVGYALLE